VTKEREKGNSGEGGASGAPKGRIILKSRTQNETFGTRGREKLISRKRDGRKFSDERGVEQKTLLTKQEFCLRQELRGNSLKKGDPPWALRGSTQSRGEEKG